MLRVSNIKLYPEEKKEVLTEKIAKKLSLSPKKIKNCQIYRQSLDARKKERPHYLLTCDVELTVSEQRFLEKKWKDVSAAVPFKYAMPKGEAVFSNRPVIVGFGPCGMFAALLLAELGLCPIVLERGKDVDSRKTEVDAFWETGKLNCESNVQFGEGGAGTFSDGKLTARTKDFRCRKVLEEFVEAGAPEEILYFSKPHIGTDNLQNVVKAIRKKIQRLGGEIRFQSKVTGIVQEGGKLQGLEINHGEVLQTEDAVFAIGHSARDTFSMLLDKGVSMEQKPFAVGVRIEHRQKEIDIVQYGEEAAESGFLPAADYRLTYTTKEGRGVYTFCMCPGGSVVAAASEEDMIATNGMSTYERNLENANSALLVQVMPEDFPDNHPLAGVILQRQLEKAAFTAGGGGYRAPAQTVGSFLLEGKNENIPKSVKATYRPGVVFTDLRKIFPEYIQKALQEALPEMDKKLSGFAAPDAVMTAVESRSSSPVRILRKEESGYSVSVIGLYPAGEGAGYAGGIVSAAIDGIKTAEKIFDNHKKRCYDTK